jgi:hypothetical protein
VDDIERALEGRSELTLQGDQLGQVGRGDAESEHARLQRRVEGATERDIERDRST